ncbi:hypothetical protein PCASD_19543 [Puccinia coronata f. sp. avenae]|uniref:Uncharacterized protein n=1 Tax=Puccinia coronata f. sp. avenae TaxID=200324 RepID=A0A2N5SMR4_9BASI|nr:hypothetical protein PCASD_19543 [Puccinia coronata f. sp. avenae]
MYLPSSSNHPTEFQPPPTPTSVHRSSKKVFVGATRLVVPNEGTVYKKTVSQVPYPAIPAANALTVSPLPSSNGGGLAPAVIQRRLTHWWSTALQAVVQPGGQGYHWKPVGPLLRQSQRWNQAHSNNPATPPSSHR